MQAAHAIARERMIESKTRSKTDYDRKVVQIAVKVGNISCLTCEVRQEIETGRE